MRELKFRGYHKKMGKLSAPVSIQHIADTESAYDPEDIIFEQYTGLKDCEGVEIYEGDICSFNGIEEIGIVVWDEFMWAVNFEGFNQEMGESMPVETLVIGNIHESKEVL